jgi:hypothetical protein
VPQSAGRSPQSDEPGRTRATMNEPQRVAKAPVNAQVKQDLPSGCQSSCLGCGSWRSDDYSARRDVTSWQRKRTARCTERRRIRGLSVSCKTTRCEPRRPTDIRPTDGQWTRAAKRDKSRQVASAGGVWGRTSIGTADSLGSGA